MYVVLGFIVGIFISAWFMRELIWWIDGRKE